MTSDAFEVNQAVEELQAIIEGSIQRAFRAICNEIRATFELTDSTFKTDEAKFKAFRNETNTKFKAKSETQSDIVFQSILSHCRALRWMMGVAIVLLIVILALTVVLIVLVANITYS